MNTTEPRIRNAAVHYDFPTIWMEPYRTETMHGEPVKVYSFIMNGSILEPHGARIKKNGEEYARSQRLDTLAHTPAEVIRLMAALTAEEATR